MLVKMRLGGASNRSLENILLKSREDWRALRSSGVGGLGALAMKNLSKLPQFFCEAGVKRGCLRCSAKQGGHGPLCRFWRCFRRVCRGPMQQWFKAQGGGNPRLRDLDVKCW